MEQDRSLPQALESERAVLGGLMLDPEQVISVAEVIAPDDFFRDAHKKLFQLFLDMAGAGEATEMLAVCERVTSTGVPDDYGGIHYLTTLSDGVPSTQNIEFYAKIVREKAQLRKLYSNTRELQELVHSYPGTVDELLDDAERRILELNEQRGGSDFTPLSTILDETFVLIQQVAEQAQEVTGVTTGFTDLDRMLAGLHPTDLVILAARPAMGKTALALNIAQNAAQLGGVGVGVFSLEMGQSQLATRLLCSQSRVDASKVRKGFLSREHDMPRLIQGVEDLHPLPIHIDDTAALSITQVRSKARRLAHKLQREGQQLGLIVIDYIGLMQGDPRINREQQVSAASRGLKALAKELDIAVLALSQLNRGVEGRTDKRPMLSDLRESGAIEQDADVILFIYRDEYYKTDSLEKGVAEVIVAKQRNGPTGTVRLAFHGEHTRFENLAYGGDDLGYV